MCVTGEVKLTIFGLLSFYFKRTNCKGKSYFVIYVIVFHPPAEQVRYNFPLIFEGWSRILFFWIAFVYV